MSAFVWAVLSALSAGAQQEVGVSTSAIINGRAAIEEDLYGTVEVLHSKSKRGFCSGTLVAPQLVITAAHCVVYKDDDTEAHITEPSKLMVGAGYLGRDSRWDGEMINVIKVMVHEDFDVTFRRGVHSNNGLGKPHDIALLVLDVPATTVTPVAIPISTRDDIDKDELVTVSGYGVSGHAGSGELRITDTWVDKVENHEILTSAPGESHGDSCFGDSGGPMYRMVQGEVHFVGIVSRMRSDAEVECGDGGIYTRVVTYRDWLVDQVTSAERLDPAILSGFDLVVPNNAALGAGASANSGCSVATHHKGQAHPFAIVGFLVMAATCCLRRRR